MPHMKFVCISIVGSLDEVL